jgi:hypothetical protein
MTQSTLKLSHPLFSNNVTFYRPLFLSISGLFVSLVISTLPSNMAYYMEPCTPHGSGWYVLRVVSLVLGWASTQYIEQTGFSVAGQAGRVGVSFMPRLGITMLKECGLGVRHDQMQPCCAPL